MPVVVYYGPSLPCSFYFPDLEFGVRVRVTERQGDSKAILYEIAVDFERLRVARRRLLNSRVLPVFVQG